MSSIGGIIMLLGYLGMFVGGIICLIAAFKESIGWGLGSLLFSPVLLIFAIMHWDDCKQGVMIWAGGFGVAIVGGVLAAAGGGGSAMLQTATTLLC